MDSEKLFQENKMLAFIEEVINRGTGATSKLMEIFKIAGDISDLNKEFKIEIDFLDSIVKFLIQFKPFNDALKPVNMSYWSNTVKIKQLVLSNKKKIKSLLKKVEHDSKYKNRIEDLKNLLVDLGFIFNLDNSNPAIIIPVYAEVTDDLHPVRFKIVQNNDNANAILEIILGDYSGYIMMRLDIRKLRTSASDDDILTIMFDGSNINYLFIILYNADEILKAINMFDVYCRNRLATFKQYIRHAEGILLPYT